MRRRRGGFSLIELLIVIGIIALLISILLPAVTRVRRMGRSTVCLAHLNQLNASFRMYLNVNRNQAFAFQKDVTSLTWFELLQPYNGSIKDTLLCPEATEPGNIIGGAFKAWGPEWTYVTLDQEHNKVVTRDRFVGSYGANGWIYHPPAEERSSISSDYAAKMIELPAHQAERIPVFADCIMEWASPDSTDMPPYDLISPLPYYSGVGDKPKGPSGYLAYFCIDRHFHAVNVAFLDGHAERVGLEELWKLKWNNAFKRKDVVLP